VPEESKEALDAVLASREAVTAALAQGDPKALDERGKAEARFKTALGHRGPVGPPSSPAPSTQGDVIKRRARIMRHAGRPARV
jgi:hypothetical protein